jgi:hypothetical protein
VLRNEGLRHAGRYRLTRSAAKEEERLLAWFASNVPPRSTAPEEVAVAEGNLDRIGREEIQKRFPDFRVEFRGEKRQGSTDMDLSAPPAAGLWKHALYLLAGILVLESVLACLFGRSQH